MYGMVCVAIVWVFGQLVQLGHDPLPEDPGQISRSVFCAMFLGSLRRLVFFLPGG